PMPLRKQRMILSVPILTLGIGIGDTISSAKLRPSSLCLNADVTAPPEESEIDVYLYRLIDPRHIPGDVSDTKHAR
ncbi:hypothetical protein, partial [Rhizobium ecuadorense]|uniref:hypothetical protein n=1 Tax=Rhizobium ecuadorense TaxID=1671795 RepID=UPI001AEBC905